MKEKVKIFVIALVLGMVVILGYQKYFEDKNIITLAKESKVTLIYDGTFNNLEEARKKQDEYKMAVILNDREVYRVVIGVSSSKDSLDLLTTYFDLKNIKYKTLEYKINNNFLKEIENYELLLKAGDKEYYSQVIEAMLKLLKNYL